MPREHRSIRELAYQLWVARGCPDGSAELDWLEAERQLAAKPTQAASAKGVDDALKDTYPASDPPSSHLPDVPPANAGAKWEAAAAAEKSGLHPGSIGPTPETSARPRASGRRDKAQGGPSNKTGATESGSGATDAPDRSRPPATPRPPGQ